ncbi:heparinase II/III family protein [Azospirillum rugosum]|uniref:Heparinase superfamily protein n=1 Tax=Azospirillum rugosum TaxID=416170 RepID=A0ABS4SIH6_9PROT|nr:heparinase II/III family protein [Azospirillum rugosum]MBP2292368.1 putative heparinase superfamily protein [Azospirillum rugosum]MDQ0526127.1 putative heparinase superfamily protein [Azospirillum rugosum]
MSGARGKIGRLREGVAQIAFGNPIYKLTLGGRAPTALSIVPPDPWPGDATEGSALLAGVFRLGGQTVTVDPNGTPSWRAGNAGWLDALHGFEWMRDLRAVGGDAARRRARALVLSWLDHNGGWHPKTWAPEVMGARISTWIGLHDFYCASADDEFRARIFDSLARQVRHLTRVVPGALDGKALVTAVKGLVYGGFCLPDTERTGQDALRLLERELPRQILPDGGHVERCPSVQLRILRDLIDVRAVLRAARAEVPETLQHAIDRMTPALRFFRHGDGGLALFNGGREEDAALVDTVLAQADARGRPLKSAPHTGFERLIAGRTMVLMDAGVPPVSGLDATAHAGTLALEMSVGKERLIVNCGSHRTATGPWRSALAGTAAHSTVVLAETNSSEVLEDGGLGRRPSHVGCERQENDGAVLVVATHNGYSRNFGYLHRRRVYLAENGEDLRGEDTLEPVIGATPEPQDFTIRFHLHPSVQASLIQGGGQVLLRMHSGAGWRLRASGGTLELEESIYLGSGDEPRRTTQIAIHGHTGPDGNTVKWALRRERKGA